MDQHFDLTSWLGNLCNQDGMISAGLGAGADPTNPPAYRIHVPKNVAAFVGLGKAGRAAIANWAAERMISHGPDTDSPEMKQYYAIMLWLAWGMGWVAYRGTKLVAVPNTKDGLEALDWDAEVIIVDDDASTTIPDKPPVWMSPDVVNKVLTILLAGKITWQQCRHHLGVAIRDARTTDERKYHGYTEKAVTGASLPGLGFADTNNRTNVHRLVHPFSTLATMSVLHAGTAIVRDLAEHHDILEGAGESTKWSIAIGSDVKMRIGQMGAGCRKLADVFVGLRHLLKSPIAPTMPKREWAVPLAREHFKVAANPFKFGDNAHYLTRQREEFDETPVTQMLPVVKVFVQRCLKGTTLSRAACFTGKPEADEGYDSAWATTCATYNMMSTSLAAIDEDSMGALLRSQGGMSGEIATNDWADALRSCGIAINTTMWNNGVKAMADQALEEQQAEQGEEAGPSTSASSVLTPAQAQALRGKKRAGRGGRGGTRTTRAASKRPHPAPDPTGLEESDQD